MLTPRFCWLFLTAPNKDVSLITPVLGSLQVSTGFQCSNMMSALPSNFLDRLLSTALMEDAEIRLFVLEILISFIDRHGNRHKFSTIRCGGVSPVLA